MVFKNLYSQRKRREEGKEKDFYSYDEIPEETRRRVFYTLARNHVYQIGGPFETSRDDFEVLRVRVIHNYGIININDERDNRQSIHKYLMKCSLAELFDCIEIFLYIKAGYHEWAKLRETIKDLNDIFSMDKIGYEIVKTHFEDLKYIIIRIDSKYLHNEVIKKTLTLLYDNSFKAALNEFENALEKYTKKEYPEAITYANSAFESVMKMIVGKDNLDAGQLIAELKKLEIRGTKFLPSHYENFGIEIKKLLNCLPITRNEKGIPHGKGSKIESVDKSFAEFALHLSGSFIVFLIERSEELKN